MSRAKYEIGKGRSGLLTEVNTRLDRIDVEWTKSGLGSSNLTRQGYVFYKGCDTWLRSRNGGK